MSTRRLQTELLAHAGQLLLEYDESTGAIHRALRATARALTDDACHIAVAYNGVAVSLAGEAPVLMPVRHGAGVGAPSRFQLRASTSEPTTSNTP
jgi:hypothetical protein